MWERNSICFHSRIDWTSVLQRFLWCWWSWKDSFLWFIFTFHFSQSHLCVRSTIYIFLLHVVRLWATISFVIIIIGVVVSYAFRIKTGYYSICIEKCWRWITIEYFSPSVDKNLCFTLLECSDASRNFRLYCSRSSVASMCVYQMQFLLMNSFFLCRFGVSVSGQNVMWCARKIENTTS